MTDVHHHTCQSISPANQRIREICAAVIIWLTHLYAHLQAGTETFRSTSPLRAWSSWKRVQWLWLQRGWAARMLRAVYRCHLHECSWNREMSKDFSLLSSAQCPVKRYITLSCFSKMSLQKTKTEDHGAVWRMALLTQTSTNSWYMWARLCPAPGCICPGQLNLDFLQCTSPRHQDDLARTSHTQRLQTKLNKAPVWVYKAQNTSEATGFCCISLYGCMCCICCVRPKSTGKGKYI